MNCFKKIINKHWVGSTCRCFGKILLDNIRQRLEHNLLVYYVVHALLILAQA